MVIKFLEHTPGIYGQLLLAVLILINSIFSWWQKKKMEKREEVRQAAIDANLELSQNLVREHAKLLKEKIEDMHAELKTNTEFNVAALETANDVNLKIATIAEAALSGPSKVEIVQPADHPIPVREVDGS